MMLFTDWSCRSLYLPYITVISVTVGAYWLYGYLLAWPIDPINRISPTFEKGTDLDSGGLTSFSRIKPLGVPLD